MDHHKSYELSASAILHEHYVDDYLDSTKTISDVVQLALDMKYVHQQTNIRNQKMVFWFRRGVEGVRLLSFEND